MQNYKIQLKAKRKYRYNGINFDSMAEIAFYIWLTDNNVKFEYHPINTSFCYLYKNKTHKYFPDFKIDGKYYEIKGTQFFKDKDISKEMINPFNRKLDGLAKAKHQCMIKNNVIILTENEYNFYLKYVKKNYGRTYLKGFSLS